MLIMETQVSKLTIMCLNTLVANSANVAIHNTGCPVATIQTAIVFGIMFNKTSG